MLNKHKQLTFHVVQVVHTMCAQAAKAAMYIDSGCSPTAATLSKATR